MIFFCFTFWWKQKILNRGNTFYFKKKIVRVLAIFPDSGCDPVFTIHFKKKRQRFEICSVFPCVLFLGSGNPLTESSMVVSGESSSGSTTTTFWGWLLVGIGSLAFLEFLFTAFISKLFPPSNYPLIAAIQNDDKARNNGDECRSFRR